MGTDPSAGESPGTDGRSEQTRPFVELRPLTEVAAELALTPPPRRDDDAREALTLDRETQTAHRYAVCADERAAAHQAVIDDPESSENEKVCARLNLRAWEVNARDNRSAVEEHSEAATHRWERYRRRLTGVQAPPRAVRSVPLPRARGAGRPAARHVARSTSSADPPADSDLPAEPARRLKLAPPVRAHLTFGVLTADRRGASAEALS